MWGSMRGTAFMTPVLCCMTPLGVIRATNDLFHHPTCLADPLHPSSLSCPGHLVLDEDVERSTFIIVTGTLCPSESLAVTLSTVQELPTLPDGALRLLLPPILTPHVLADPESEPASLCDDRLALW